MRSQKHSVRFIAVMLALALLCAAAAFAASGIWVEEGENQVKNAALVVDKSHAEDGYILASVEGKSNKYKLRISLGETTYNYDIAVEDGFVAFPLQMGSGKYKCVLYKNTGGKKYAQAGKVSFDVKLGEEYNAFLCSNQYVAYTRDSVAVETAASLCGTLTDDMDKVKAVYDFMTKGFAYDYVRALTAKQSYLSDVDKCFEERKGLCQDLAAVTACMLRSQGIPTQLVIGYADSTYHAWNRVLIDGEYRRLDITAALSGMGKDVVYTAERYY